MMTRVAIIALLAGIGCAGFTPTGRVMERAKYDLDCAETKINIDEVTMERYEARGCGKMASYILQSSGDLTLNQPVKRMKETN